VVNNIIERELMERFANMSMFTRDELFNFFRSFDPNLNEGTFGWRVYDLKKKNIIETLKKGVYQLVHKHKFKPELDKSILAISKVLDPALYDYYNIWETAWLNEFVELQATTSMTILEADKDSVDRLFYTLKDKDFANVFLKPDEDVLEKYVSELKESIIIKPMISRAPTHTIKTIVVPTLEKILVDLYCDEKLFFAYQGSQLIKIYEGAFEKYTINLSRLLNYAKRRNREEGIKEFLLKNLNETIKSLVE